MLLIPCPHCGPRAQEEFQYERTRDSVVNPGDEPAVAMAALYARENPRGISEEVWRHGHGCGMWLDLRRDRSSHVIIAVRPVGDAA